MINYKRSLFEMLNSLTLDFLGFFYELTGLSKFSKDKKIVLCYHSIGNTGWRFSTKTADFKNHIDFFKKNYKLRSLRDLMKKGKFGVNISFDDGYRDVYENAFPLLEKNKIPVTMFVLGNNEKANKIALDNELPILDLSRIRILKKNGWEIGHHSETHRDLFNLDVKQLRKEIIDSKKQLEKNLGFKIDYFAYPKGFYSQKIIALVKEAGFKGAFTVDGKEMEPSNPMLLHRVPIEGAYNVKQLETLLSPLGLFITNFYMKLLQMKIAILNKFKGGYLI